MFDEFPSNNVSGSKGERRRNGRVSNRRSFREHCAPRGLCFEDAAYYIGLSPTKFAQLVNDGRMPLPKIADRRKIWCRMALDDAFESLPVAGGHAAQNANPWREMSA